MPVTILRRRAIFGAAAIATLFLIAADPAAAGGRHRARLGADLAEDLEKGAPAIDVILHGTRAEVDALASRYNLRVRKRLRSGAVLRLTAGQLDALRQDEAVDHLSSDMPIRSTGDVTAESIGADQVWAGAYGLRPLSGAGVGVAVIDSGVDARHPALRGRVAASIDFIGGDGGDGFGHGTHVAALIAGGGGPTADTAAYRGIAGGARIISLRVLDEHGAGRTSDVIEAIDWAIENRRAHGIRVINLSLGGPVVQPYRDDPLCEAVERAVAAGLIVVAAAGNHGQTAEGRTQHGGITSPGNDPHAITVGALDMRGTAARSDDVVAGYSSKGPTQYDLVMKPDLAAPGTRLVSAAAAGSYLARRYPERVVAGGAGDGYLALSGTSMAAAVVSGAVALLVERRPELGAAEARLVLQASSSFMTLSGLTGAGAGSLNVLAAAALLERRPAVREQLSGANIAGETIEAGGVTWLGARSGSGHRAFKALGGRTLRIRFVVVGNELVAQNVTDNKGLPIDTVIWGNSLESTVWGRLSLPRESQPGLDTVIWGTGETIIWGLSAGSLTNRASVAFPN